MYVTEGCPAWVPGSLARSKRQRRRSKILLVDGASKTRKKKKGVLRAYLQRTKLPFIIEIKNKNTYTPVITVKLIFKLLSTPTDKTDTSDTRRVPACQLRSRPVACNTSWFAGLIRVVASTLSTCSSSIATQVTTVLEGR